MIPDNLKDRARLAAEALDRFPVSDDTSYLVRSTDGEEVSKRRSLNGKYNSGIVV